MKIPYLIATSLCTALVCAASPVISIDRTQYYYQTASSTSPTDAKPFALNFHINGSSDLSGWGPAFYKPGSGGVPESGTSSDTITGTLNFSALPNNYADFLFTHDFATDADMTAFYPVAPTDGGAYGIKFGGSTPPSPTEFTDGLVFSTGTTYPSATPQITSMNNGAVWAGNVLRIKRSGVTTLSLNAFPEYSSTTYGSLITAGFHNATGNLAAAARESGYLPMGDSSENPEPISQPPVTEISVAGAWFAPGRTYVLELQYAVIAGRPEEALLNGVEFQGVAAYRKVTRIQVTTEPSPVFGDLNNDRTSDVIWENTATGKRTVWFMNGATVVSAAALGDVPVEWSIAGSADFNNDGKNDIVWQNTVTGRRTIWFMNGAAQLSGAVLAEVAAEWNIAAVGDLNADGLSDLVWQNTLTGKRTVWYMNGTATTSAAVLGTFAVEWNIAGAGDFNGDGQSDLLWENTTTGERTIQLMNGSALGATVALGTIPVEWRIAGAGDLNTDGKSDIIWQNTATGKRTVWFMNGTAQASAAVLGTVPVEWRIAN